MTITIKDCKECAYKSDCNKTDCTILYSEMINK